MGIKGLIPELRKTTPSAFANRNVKDYQGGWVVIDAMNVMFIYMAVAQKKTVGETKLVMGEKVDHVKAQQKMMKMLVDYIVKFVANGVAPLFVFDGLDKKEKSQTTDERKRKKQVIVDEIKELEKKLVPIDSLDFSSIKPDTMIIAQRLSNLLNQVPYLTDEDIFAFQEILAACGLPFLTAKGEGEKLCSSICVHGYARAVVSCDSDNLAFGCPRVMISTTNDPLVFSEVTLNTVLYELKQAYPGMDTFSKFVDMCIMCGCDFNTNIRNIGIKKSIGLLSKHGSIEGVAASGIDVSCLRHEICREIFKDVDPNSLIQDDRQLDEILVLDKSFEGSRDTFERYEIEPDKIILFLKNLEVEVGLRMETFPAPVPPYTFTGPAEVEVQQPEHATVDSLVSRLGVDQDLLSLLTFS